MAIPIKFGVGSNPGRHGQDGTGRLINCYAENAGREGKTPFPIYAIEGYTQFANHSGGGGLRGSIVVDGVGYAVVGTLVISLDQSGNTTFLGGFPGNSKVYMAANKASTPQIALVSEGAVKIIQGGVLSLHSDADLPPPVAVVELDGYLVFAIADGRFFITGINNTAVNALDFATAEGKADSLIVPFVQRRELWLMGSESIEPWRNTGNADFPFERLPGTFIERGILAGGSAGQLDNTIIWVGDDEIVYRANGYSPQRISNHSIERDIAACSDKSGITATTYTIRGHPLYVLSCDDWTRVYDASTGQWHNRESSGETRWRGEGYMKLAGKHIVGDFEAGTFYNLDPDVLDEAGTSITVTLESPISHAYPNQMIIDRFYTDVIRGVGINSTDTDVSDPDLMLSFSDDGGNTWSADRFVRLGKLGERETRVWATRLGRTSNQGRTWRIRVSASVVRAFMGAAIEGQKLAA